MSAPGDVTCRSCGLIIAGSVAATYGGCPSCGRESQIGPGKDEATERYQRRPTPKTTNRDPSARGKKT